MEATPESNYSFVLDRYDDKIKYYWKAATTNKKAYKLSRSVTIILGALVTLISSLASADFITSVQWLKITFSIATPIFAAVLTISGGFAQSFHWGATWRDMVLNAERLEKEYDRVKVTKPENIDLAKEVDLLNEIVITETQSFFQRVLDVTKIITKSKKQDEQGS